MKRNKSLQKIKNSIIGKKTVIRDFVNLYNCVIGDNCLVGPFVEIQSNVFIGNNVKVESHSFLCEGIKIEDDVFVGHHVVFTNDKYPKSVSKPEDWKLEKTTVKKGASIGSNSTILGGITIGENSIIGGGSVVTKDVPKNSIVYGNPAKLKRRLSPKR